MMTEMRTDVPPLGVNNNKQQLFTIKPMMYSITPLSSAVSSRHGSELSIISATQPTRRCTRTKAVIATLAITFVVLAALLSVAFVFDFANYARKTRHDTIRQHGGASTTRAQRISELDVTDELKETKLTDSIPSGFHIQVDYVRGEGDVQTSATAQILNGTIVNNSSEQQANNETKATHAPAIIGAPEANVVAVAPGITADKARDLVSPLRNAHPELFENGPSDAVNFRISPIDTSIDTWLGDDHKNSDVLHVQPETFGTSDMEGPKNPDFDIPPPTLPLEPPSGAWQHLITPPPLPEDKRPKILFQETEPQLPWGGPAGATWFSGPIDTAEQPKETRVAAPWMGVQCSIVTSLTGQKRVEGEKCGTQVWYPYHYDVYPNSAPSDWVYIDMNEGARSHVWPGAGPFRKIQVQNKPDGTKLSNGPICLDLPPTPSGYTGVRPDELDCSAYLQRVKGFGDDKQFTLTSSLNDDEIGMSWWFTWRNL